MSYRLRWTKEAASDFAALRTAAEKAALARERASKQGKKRTKSSKQEGLFKQVAKAVNLLADDPRHPSLNTHEFSSLVNPLGPGKPVYEAYAQNKTPGAYRIFWCYGPKRGDMTIIAITPHP